MCRPPLCESPPSPPRRIRALPCSLMTERSPVLGGGARSWLGSLCLPIRPLPVAASTVSHVKYSEPSADFRYPAGLICPSAPVIPIVLIVPAELVAPPPAVDPTALTDLIDLIDLIEGEQPRQVLGGDEQGVHDRRQLAAHRLVTLFDTGPQARLEQIQLGAAEDQPFHPVLAPQLAEPGRTRRLRLVQLQPVEPTV